MMILKGKKKLPLIPPIAKDGPWRSSGGFGNCMTASAGGCFWRRDSSTSGVISTTVSSDANKRNAPPSSPSSSLRSTLFFSASVHVFCSNFFLPSPLSGIFNTSAVTFFLILTSGIPHNFFSRGGGGGTVQLMNANLNSAAQEATEFSEKHRLIDAYCF